MGKSYSLDLRERVVSFVGLGRSRREAASRFDVSASFAVKVVSRHERTGSSAARTFDELWQSIGDICLLYEPQECWNCFKADGYAFD